MPPNWGSKKKASPRTGERGDFPLFTCPIDSFSPDLAKRLADAIRGTARGILSGAIRSGLLDKHYGDANAIAEYREHVTRTHCHRFRACCVVPVINWRKISIT